LLGNDSRNHTVSNAPAVIRRPPLFWVAGWP
jgi:hypothetical protein